MNSKDKIYIIGCASMIGTTAIGKKIAEMDNVEFISQEQADEMNIPIYPRLNLEYPAPILLAETNFSNYKDGKSQRRERRKQARKNKAK